MQSHVESTSARSEWVALGNRSPRALTPFRLQLHWAAQIVSAAGHTFAEPRSDDSHTSLTWDAAERRLLGEPLRGTAVRAGLDVAELALVVVIDGVARATFPLDGRTLDEGYAGMARLLEETSAGAHSGPLNRREYDMPDHPVGRGVPFDVGTQDAFAELARWYGNAAALLETIRVQHPGASVVRCWPHHFDIAVLIALASREGRPPGSIGVGMTPGDDSYAEPYWYVTPFPIGEDPVTPPLPGGGRWREDWFGAVLTGTDLVAADGAPAQVRAASAFLDAAIAAARAIVAGAEEGS